MQGAVHVIPCGSIAKLANLTKDFAYAVVDAVVSHRNDPDVVLKAARAAGQDIAKDVDSHDAVIGNAEVLGIESLDEAGYRVRLRIRTIPHRQWEVVRELRFRLKQSFDKAGVDLNTPGSSSTRS